MSTLASVPTNPTTLAAATYPSLVGQLNSGPAQLAMHLTAASSVTRLDWIGILGQAHGGWWWTTSNTFDIYDAPTDNLIISRPIDAGAGVPLTFKDNGTTAKSITISGCTTSGNNGTFAYTSTASKFGAGDVKHGGAAGLSGYGYVGAPDSDLVDGVTTISGSATLAVPAAIATAAATPTRNRSATLAVPAAIATAAATPTRHSSATLAVPAAIATTHKPTRNRSATLAVAAAISTTATAQGATVNGSATLAVPAAIATATPNATRNRSAALAVPAVIATAAPTPTRNRSAALAVPAAIATVATGTSHTLGVAASTVKQRANASGTTPGTFTTDAITSPASGGAMIYFVARGDQADLVASPTPTDSKSNTPGSALAGGPIAYTGFASSAHAVHFATGITGGSGHTVTANYGHAFGDVSKGDEITLGAIALNGNGINNPVLHDSAFVYRAAASSLLTPSVTFASAGKLYVGVFGEGGTGRTHGFAPSSGAKITAACAEGDPSTPPFNNGYVQVTWIEVSVSGGTFPRAVTITLAPDLVSGNYEAAGIYALAVQEAEVIAGSATLAVPAAIATTHKPTRNRSAALAIPAAIATAAPNATRNRSATLAVPAAIDTTHKPTRNRSATLAVPAAIATTAAAGTGGSATLVVSAAIATVAVPTRNRSAALAVPAAIATAAATPTRNRSAALAVPAAIASSATPTRNRSATLAIPAAIHTSTSADSRGQVAGGAERPGVDDALDPIVSTSLESV